MRKENGKRSTPEAQDRIFRTISENAHDCIFCKDCDLKYTYANPAMLRLLNREESDVIGKTPEEVFGREAADVISEVDSPVLAGETIDEVKMLPVGNQDYYFHTIQVPILEDDGSISGICGFVRDVTNRMKLDSILHLQRDLSVEFSKAVGLKEVLRCLLEHSLKIEFIDAGGIYLRNPKNGSLDLVIHQGLPDDFVAIASHYDAESPQAKLVMNDGPIYLNYFQSQFPVDQSHFEEQLKAVAVVPLKNENVIIGALNLVSHTQEEFSEYTRHAIEVISGMTGGAIVRAQTHDALQKSEKNIRAILDTAPLGITTSDMNGVVTSCNQATLDLHGYSDESELIGVDALSLIAPEDREKASGNIARTLREGMIKGVEYHVLRKDGGIIPIMMSASVSRDESGEFTGFLAISQDISQARQMELRLRQSEKMQAIGLLAGGIAHDFNNQLAGIVGYADILREELSNSPELSHFADNILLATKRASDLTSQLLAFARKGKYLSASIDIHKIIGEVVGILERTIDRRILIKQHLDAQMAQSLGDPTQIQNAVMNIALNARDAMPGGGELIIATSIIQLDKDYCETNLYEIEPGAYVQICLTDNGIGMDEATRNKIFEPFFTTKKQGKGTGMGLASVYGTVKNHCGAIHVYSESGHGTTVKIYLPHAPSITESDHGSAVQFEPDQGNSHILLVDDEAIVLDSASIMLEKSGYRVSACSNGREALAYYRDNWKTIDLVILDMVMPEMGGRETFLEMKKISPQIRALLSSGYSINGEAQQILDEGVMGFIQKPYRRIDFAQKVANILKEARD